MTLFEEEKIDYSLFCSQRHRVIYKQKLTDQDATAWTERLHKAKCTNLTWTRAGDLTIRNYVVKR